jgi:multiple sugar transport system permease protein
MAATTAAARPVRRRVLASRQNRRSLALGLLFCSPWIISLLGLHLIPVALSFYYSFTDYNVLQPAKWVGFDNFVGLFQDQVFWQTVQNTLIYAVMSIPAGVFFALGLALLLNTKIRGLAIWRTIYFLPTVLPTVAVSIVWLWVFNPLYGPVNWFLDLAGLPGPGWFADEHWGKIGLVLLSLWSVGQIMVIYLAGLQDVPQDLYDAAAVDGASVWQKTVSVTLPMMTPVIFFNLILALIGIFSYFDAPYVITDGLGNPAHSMLFYAMYLYRNAFSLFHMGIASAMAWMQFLVTLLVALIVFGTSGRWVYYGGGDTKK